MVQPPINLAWFIASAEAELATLLPAISGLRHLQPTCTLLLDAVGHADRRRWT